MNLESIKFKVFRIPRHKESKSNFSILFSLIEALNIYSLDLYIEYHKFRFEYVCIIVYI